MSAPGAFTPSGFRLGLAENCPAASEDVDGEAAVGSSERKLDTCQVIWGPNHREAASASSEKLVEGSPAQATIPEHGAIAKFNRDGVAGELGVHVHLCAARDDRDGGLA